MVVTNLQPQSRIAEYVDRILILENDKAIAQFSLPLYANGVPTLLFTTIKGKIGGHQYSHLTLFGQTIHPEDLILDGNFVLIAYFFKPYSLLSLFEVSPQTLTDNPTDMHLIMAKRTGALQEQLLNTADLSERIKCLDKYIVGMIEDSRPACPPIKYATKTISTRPTKEALISVQKDLHITERTFQRMFEKNIGIAPNVYRRICQFNTAFVQLNNRKYNTLTEVAFENGYADQSHYVRAFREFTNITPTEYLNYGKTL